MPPKPTASARPPLQRRWVKPYPYRSPGDEFSYKKLLNVCVDSPAAANACPDPPTSIHRLIQSSIPSCVASC